MGSFDGSWAFGMLVLRLPFIVASQSPVRQRLLKEAGVKYDVVPSQFNEESAKASIAHLPIPEQALYLAHEKAKEVSGRYPEAVVLGADQMGEFQGEPLFKPRDESEAIAMLQRLSGHAHLQHTAACLYQGPRCVWSTVQTARLSMRALTKAHILAYIQADLPFVS